jgi:hypothetical protein
MRNFINKKINKETYKMNFISTFDELNKLYEEDQKVDSKQTNPITEGGYVAHYSYDGSEKKAPQWWLDKGGTDASWREQQRINNSGKHDEETGQYIWGNQRQLHCDAEEATGGQDLIEAADDEEVEIVDEPRQVICECDKCGALVIKDEADIIVDEETDLANVEDKCEFCEEANGYKIVGVVAPYESVAEEAPVEDVVEESLNNSKLLKEIEKTNELKTEHESEYLTLNEEAEDIIDEDLGDVVRKVFDKPASIATQQSWEDELNDDSTTPARRKALEKKFAQQRDWEAKHPDKEVK